MTPSLGLRSWGLSDLEEEEEEAVSVSFPEQEAEKKKREERWEMDGRKRVMRS